VVISIGLHPIASIRFVTSDYAAGRRSQNSVMPGVMARHAPDSRTFEAALCLSYGNSRQSNTQSRACDKCLQCRLHILSEETIRVGDNRSVATITQALGQIWIGFAAMKIMEPSEPPGVEPRHFKMTGRLKC
jgi:hypothetical protein